MSVESAPDPSRPVAATPLARLIARRIADSGPITVREYMTLCLSHPEHGYYRARRAIGAAGDFITAPEISQVFGELLGLWAAVVWQQMGSPAPFQLVELGPGCGTMMADALRATQRVKGFSNAARVVLVEASPVLRDMQRQTLAQTTVDVRWLAEAAEIKPAPTILLANEFLDVLPITQLMREGDGWHEITVELDVRGTLTFGSKAACWREALPSLAHAAPIGSVLELRDFAPLSETLAAIAAGSPLGALFIDYGHEATGFGDTLQAVRQHRSEPPLAAPGEADLTAMVDFEAAAAALTNGRVMVERLATQAEFLGSLGAIERGSRLMSANPARAGEIEMGVARLMSPQGMGTRFKALGLRSSDMPTLPGFPQH
ncbi:MAG: class I SAM-dependent methyltransferase [Hyphomicrobiaceae bacterium]